MKLSAIPFPLFSIFRNRPRLPFGFGRRRGSTISHHSEVFAPPPSYTECVNQSNQQTTAIEPDQNEAGDTSNQPPSYNTVKREKYLEITHPVESEMKKLKRFSTELSKSNRNLHLNLSLSDSLDSAIVCDGEVDTSIEIMGEHEHGASGNPSCTSALPHCRDFTSACACSDEVNSAVCDNHVDLSENNCSKHHDDINMINNTVSDGSRNQENCSRDVDTTIQAIESPFDPSEEQGYYNHAFIEDREILNSGIETHPKPNKDIQGDTSNSSNEYGNASMYDVVCDIGTSSDTDSIQIRIENEFIWLKDYYYADEEVILPKGCNESNVQQKKEIHTDVNDINAHICDGANAFCEQLPADYETQIEKEFSWLDGYSSDIEPSSLCTPTSESGIDQLDEAWGTTNYKENKPSYDLELTSVPMPITAECSV